MQVRLFNTLDGGQVEIEAGLITRDDGLETFVYLSLFGGNVADKGGADTSQSWWGNIGELRQERVYRGGLEALLNEIPSTASNLRRIEQEAKRLLQTAVSSGVASSVDVTARLLAPKKIQLNIIFNGNREITFVLNWLDAFNQAPQFLPDVTVTNPVPGLPPANWVGATPTQTIIDNPAAASIGFASDIALARETRDRIIVGAANSTEGGNTFQGRVYIFRLDGSSWVVEQTLTSPSVGASQLFGSVVRMSGDGSRAFVTLGNSNLTGQSNVYYYKRTGTTWALQQTITTTYPTGTVTNAMDVSADGARLIVRNNSSSGRIQLFEYNSGSDSYSLATNQPPIPVTNNNTGLSTGISQDGNVIVLSEHGNNQVRVLQFDDPAWSLRQAITSVASSAVLSKAISVSENGDFFSYTPNITTGNNFLVYSWNGTTYSSIVNLDDTEVIRSSGINSDGTIAAAVRQSDCEALIYQNNALAQTITPSVTPVNGQSRYSELSYDGRMLVIGNFGFNSNVGRIVIYSV